MERLAYICLLLMIFMIFFAIIILFGYFFFWLRRRYIVLMTVGLVVLIGIAWILVFDTPDYSVLLIAFVMLVLLMVAIVYRNFHR